MNKADLYAHPGWQWCTAEGARKQVLLLGIESTLRQKLEWLEEAETITLRLRAHKPPSQRLSARGARQSPVADSSATPTAFSSVSV